MEVNGDHGIGNEKDEISRKFEQLLGTTVIYFYNCFMTKKPYCVQFENRKGVQGKILQDNFLKYLLFILYTVGK